MDWTIKQAKEAERGDELNWKCLDVLGIERKEKFGEPSKCWFDHRGDKIVLDKWSCYGVVIPPMLRVSQSSRGAYRARKWLREKGFKVSMEDLGDEIRMKYDGGSAKAGAENLATARLLLVVAIEEGLA